MSNKISFVFLVEDYRITSINLNGSWVTERALQNKDYLEFKLWDKYNNLKSWINYNYHIWAKDLTTCKVVYPYRRIIERNARVTNDLYEHYRRVISEVLT